MQFYIRQEKFYEMYESLKTKMYTDYHLQCLPSQTNFIINQRII